MDETFDFDTLSLKFCAMGFALEGLREHAKGCQVEPVQVEAIEFMFRDLKREYLNVLREAGQEIPMLG